MALGVVLFFYIFVRLQARCHRVLLPLRRGVVTNNLAKSRCFATSFGYFFDVD